MNHEKRVVNIAAAILAGGKNTRMRGKNKALICLDGSRLIRRIIDKLNKIFEEIIIATNSPQDFSLYKKECSVTKDIIKEAGPLGGIHSALSRTSKQGVFFVACDMPFLHNGLILRQITYFNRKGCDAVVPRLNSFIEPLHAVYKKDLKDNIYKHLKENNDYSVRGFLKTADVYYLDLKDRPMYRRIFKNLNTPQDLGETTGGIRRFSIDNGSI